MRTNTLRHTAKLALEMVFVYLSCGGDYRTRICDLLRVKIRMNIKSVLLCPFSAVWSGRGYSLKLPRPLFPSARFAVWVCVWVSTEKVPAIIWRGHPYPSCGGVMEQYENRIGKAPSRPIEPIIETAPPIILFLIICARPAGIHMMQSRGRDNRWHLPCSHWSKRRTCKHWSFCVR